MKIVFILALILFVVGMMACSSKPPPPGAPEATLANIPDWYANPTRDPNYLFSANTATSRDMQLAIDKAKKQAQADLTMQMEAKVKAITKSFNEEMGMSADSQLLTQFTGVANAVVSNAMNAIKVKEQDILVESGIYRVFVLMELPVGAASAALMQQIKNNENLYNRFSTSRAFEMLEQEVEKYRQFKKEQGMMK